MCLRRLAGMVVLVSLATGAARAGETAGDLIVQIFEDETIQWIEGAAEIEDPDGFVVRFEGHSVERTISLPPVPENQRDARRIIASVAVEPIESDKDGAIRPNDLWTRLGNVTVQGPSSATEDEPAEFEIIRFITGYGAPGVFEQDVTTLAPLLSGEQTLRCFISTYSERPGWRVSLSLRYSPTGVGQRRPVFAKGLINDMHVHAEAPKALAELEVPEGLDRPRLRILSTGHATDGMGGNEFMSCTNVLRVDGVEVARWRPWSERGGALREENPWAGRMMIDGREIRSSDFDRSGWHPGQVVEPLVIPLPELTPGPHEVEIEVLGIRPKDPPDEAGKEHHGYWVVSAVVVADEPWPRPGEDGS